MSETNKSDWRWYAVGSLNGKLSFDTYCTYKYSDMPVVAIDPKYVKMKRIQDLKSSIDSYPSMNSPTGCYFKTRFDDESEENQSSSECETSSSEEVTTDEDEDPDKRNTKRRPGPVFDEYQCG